MYMKTAHYTQAVDPSILRALTKLMFKLRLTILQSTRLNGPSTTSTIIITINTTKKMYKRAWKFRPS